MAMEFPSGGRQRAPKVLVVDDEEAIRVLLKRCLEPEGYIVETAEDGHAALDKLGNAGPFNLLITDIRMPHVAWRRRSNKGSGIAVARAGG